MSDWTIYITNDTCPDYTWGNSEAQTRTNFAELIRSHLDEMTRTDGEQPESQDRYNMAVTLEALCFLHRYPERKDELVRRIKEGRICLSPFSNNTLWGFQSVESAIRSLYPARRLEREWQIPIDVANHIECPSLPWGAASLLAGCGVRWLSIAWLDYDTTFAQLKNPPVFILEGPDGSRIRVVMDSWASKKANYVQGKYLLTHPDAVETEWLPHYRQLEGEYHPRAILASGTHGDTHASSAGETHGFAETIKSLNAQPEPHPKFVNATLDQFCRAIDKEQAKAPFMQTLRGDFGHSWELWTVSLAKIAAAMRQEDRNYLAVETLIAAAGWRNQALYESTRGDRERAEWCWTMLADHAWNGASDENRLENIRLRKTWGAELSHWNQSLLKQGWEGMGLSAGMRDLTLFNSLSVPRADIVCVRAPTGVAGVAVDGKSIPAQVVAEEGEWSLYFVSPYIAGFGLASVKLTPLPGNVRPSARLQITPTEIDSPYYHLHIDTNTGGIDSLLHKPTGHELVVGKHGRGICQSVFFDGREHPLADLRTEMVAEGPVLARLKVSAMVAGIHVENFVTLHAELDRVDFDVRIHKPVTMTEQRLCQLFPILRADATLRIETTGAVLRPYPAPQGDLLPGADTRRFAVQGFVDISAPGGAGVTLAPLDSYALRQDLEPLTFEAIGNDQNYKEVTTDQDGATDFRFRYSLRGHGAGYDGAAAFAWSRSVATPLLTAPGHLLVAADATPAPVIDAARAIATCLKPADGANGKGMILRLWETAGQSGPVTIGAHGVAQAIHTDLLERDRRAVPVVGGTVTVDLRAHGFASLRLLP